MDATIAGILALDGLTNGAVYALLALATVLVFTVTRVIFIPQGEFVAFGALTLALLQTGRVPGTVWVNQDGGDFVADDDLEEWVAPWEPSWGIAPSPVDRPTIQALSAAQVARSKMQFSGVAIGGRVLIAELSKDAIRCQL